MLGAQPCVRTLSTGIASTRDEAVAIRRPFTTRLRSSSSVDLSVLRSRFRPQRCSRPESFSIFCRSSYGDEVGRSGESDGGDLLHDYLQASILVSETILHYGMRKRGFQEDMDLKFPNKLVPFSLHPNESRVRVYSLGQSFFCRFQSPTVFLKTSLDGDFVLPIVVGDYAIEKLIAQLGTENVYTLDQSQYITILVEKLGYEVTMVRIRERLVDTYFASLCFSKPGENKMLSVDVCSSDAINIANKWKVPIYVKKQLVFTDAIKIGSGIEPIRRRDSNCTYDASLDIVTDGPDVLAEELDMVKNMKIAIHEERYKDAATWRNKLMKLRKSNLEGTLKDKLVKLRRKGRYSGI